METGTKLDEFIKYISNILFVNKSLEIFLRKNEEEQKKYTQYIIEKNAKYLK